MRCVSGMFKKPPWNCAWTAATGLFKPQDLFARKQLRAIMSWSAQRFVGNTGPEKSFLVFFTGHRLDSEVGLLGGQTWVSSPKACVRQLGEAEHRAAVGITFSRERSSSRLEQDQDKALIGLLGLISPRRAHSYINIHRDFSCRGFADLFASQAIFNTVICHRSRSPWSFIIEGSAAVITPVLCLSSIGRRAVLDDGRSMPVIEVPHQHRSGGHDIAQRSWVWPSLCTQQGLGERGHKNTSAPWTGTEMSTKDLFKKQSKAKLCHESQSLLM